MHITGIFLVITMATIYPGKKEKNSFTYSKDNRVPSPYHLNIYILQSLRAREYERNEIQKNQYTKELPCGIWNAHFCTEESSLVLS